MGPSPMAARAAGGCSSAALAFFGFHPLRRAVRPAAAFAWGQSSPYGGCRSGLAHSLVDSVLDELRSRRRVRVSAKIGLQGTKELSNNKIDKRALQKGLLLEFHKDSERSLLAVVERPDGKKNWMVTDQNGILSSIKPQQVTYVVPGVMNFDSSRIDEFLKKAQDLLDPMVLECAWMELSEKDKSITVEEFAEIVYGNKESLESYCAHFLLSRDIVYFVKVESRDYSMYQPRSPPQVEELLRRKRAKEEADKELEEFVHLLKSAKALPMESKPPKSSWLVDEKVRQKIEALQAYAVDACDDEQRRLAGNILKAMGFTRTSSAALKLLINVGYFPVHVNLDLFKYDVRITYTEEVLSAAEELLADRPDSDMHIRKDLSTLKVYAIDVDEADELDDALSAIRLPDGRIKVWIHVADPTCLIKPRSIIDREAMHRGTSIFLPTATFPMFPERLAMNAMSLQQGKQCKSVSVSVTLHPDGSIAEYTLENSVIKPTYMLTYESATELLYMNLEEEEELRILQEAASIRAQWRRSQGSIDTAMIEPRIKVSNPDDPEPNINLYVEDQANPAMQLVSEMMILCGEAVAAFGADNNLPLPYRGHPQSNTAVSAFSHLPDGPARSFANISVLRAAEMDFQKPVPHGVLGIPGYVQFTSPIRRYVDLLAHYQVKAFLRGDSPPYSAGDLEGMTFIASMHVKVARRLHSNSLRYWLLEYLRRQPKGRKYKALILKFVKDRMAALLLVEFGMTIQGVQCDNGREFDNFSARTFFLSHGIHLRMSCPYTSAQNGKAERIIRSINNVVRSLLIQASIPPSFWAAALGTATYLLNILPTKTLAFATPHFALLGKSPSYEHLRVFGCKCYPNLAATAPHKLSPRSSLCVFLGYSPHHKGYLCLDRHTNRTIISRHVVFKETSFPFSEDSSPPTRAAFDFLDDLPNMVSVPFELSPVFSSTGSTGAATFPGSSSAPGPSPDQAPAPLAPALVPLPVFQPRLSGGHPTPPVGSLFSPGGPLPSGSAPSSDAVAGGCPRAGSPGFAPVPPASGGRSSIVPAAPAASSAVPGRFRGQVYSRRRPPAAATPASAGSPPTSSSAVPASVIAAPTAPASLAPVPTGAVAIPPVANQHGMTTRGKRGFRFPTLFEALALSPVPRSYRAALADPHWRAAMEQEYYALLANNTWDLIPRPSGSNVVTGKWVFKHKFKADGSLERYKAQWVLRGFTQRPGIVFSETFSPVVKPATVRTVLSLALSRGWPIHQLDVNNAFLHGSLSETVHCAQPAGFEDSAHPDYVCCLNRSLYGLKQAPRAWYSRFTSYLLQLGFVEAKTDTSMFVYRKGEDMVYLLLYVDDIVLIASSMSLLRRTISSLQQEFSMKDLGKLHHFLGMHVQHTASGILLSQLQYMIEILERAGMSDCKPCTTPVDVNPKLFADGAPVSHPTDFRSLAGALQYLTFTRSDISYAVQQVCLHMHDPRGPHLAALKRILRYVRGTLHLGLLVRPSSQFELVVYSDADWAGCPDTRKSTSGYAVFLGDNLVSWSSKRQNTVSRSSAEAEYRVVANAVAEATWIRQLLSELHTPLRKTTLVYCDIIITVYMSSNPVQHQRTKHVEIDLHFVREHVALGDVRVLHVPTTSQFADVFTKGPPSSVFTEFRSSLNIRPTDASTAGGC